jgi:hypothetical protein
MASPVTEKVQTSNYSTKIDFQKSANISETHFHAEESLNDAVDSSEPLTIGV